MDSDTAASTNCLPAGVQIGEYHVLDVIGEGGFGIVYRAKDLALDREVAIKEYMPVALAGRQSSHHVHARSQHRSAFDAGLRSFINEARLLARFSHPTLVHVYRFFEASGTAYMVMRYYEGQTLRRALENPSFRMDQERLCALLAPLLDVLETLHAEDCFHRDIAPDNIFVQHDGSPVLLDFGAARRIIGDMTQALTMVLKPGFAPIEQYVDDGAMPQGAWTDIYQVGALMYLAITGSTPATSVARMVNDPLQPLTSAQAPGFSDVFLYGMHRALAVRPQERPQSIAELKSLLGLSTTLDSTTDSTKPSIAATQPIPSTPTPVHTVQQPARTAPTPLARPLPVPATQVPASPVVQPPLVTLVDHAGATATTMAPLDIEQVLPPVQPATQPSTLTEETRPTASPASFAASRVDPSTAGPHLSSTPSALTKPSRATAVKPLVITACAVATVVAAALIWFNNHQNETRATTLAARDSLAWQQAQSQSTLPVLQDYLDSFPEGRHRADAQALMRQLINEASPVSAPKDEWEAPQEPAPLAEASNTPWPSEPVEPSEPVTSIAVAPVVATPNAAVRTPAVAMGKVHFRIAPWGYVSVNRAAARASPPMTQLELPEGEYRIDISNPGAGSVTAVTKTIQVKSGEPVTVSHLFE